MAQDSQILVTRSSMPSLEEYVAEIEPLFESHWLTNMGVKHQQLEAELRSFLEVPTVSLFTNGHQALEGVLEALELEGEVITTPFTFVSTTNAICRKGLKPVFCDIRESDYTLDPALIESLITDDTCAIVPVHVYGSICDVEAIQAIADKYSLKVVYDAAHAFGVRAYGRSIACYGDASMFSFHATKVFNTIEGGAVACADPEVYDLLSKWKNFGITGPEDAAYIGGNAKMNEFCAAMGICNLRHLGEEIAKRKLVDSWYRERLDGVEGLQLRMEQAGVESNYAYFPVRFKSSCGCTRDDAFKALEAEGIHARKYFYPIISDMTSYKASFDSEMTPIAKLVASEVLTVPFYADLSNEVVDRICDILLDTIEKGSK